MWPFNYYCLLPSLLLWLSILGSNGQLQRIHVDPDTRYFTDPQGRVRLFHGINSVIKGFPWYDTKLTDPKRQQEIADLGFNVLRLGAMWTGVEPEEGVINDTYIDILKTMVTDFEKLGVYVLLDMHQDVLWKAGPNSDDGYWGVPPWIKAKMELPPEEHLSPWPIVEKPRWECGYFTEEVSRGFGQFYDNVGGTADSFAKFWGTMAGLFKDMESVLGYELINEPFAGDLFSSAGVFLPGIAGSRNLAPLYEKASVEIRAQDDETILFWEPVTWAYFFPIAANAILDNTLANFMDSVNLWDLTFALQLYCGNISTPMLEIPEKTSQGMAQFVQDNPSVFGPGLTQVPGGPEYNNRTVMSWHYYCWVFDLGGGADDDINNVLTQLFCDVLLGPTVYRTARMRAKEIGGGTMLTEFGLCTPNITNPENPQTIECNAVMEEADTFFESWTYWDAASGGAIWDTDGNLIPETGAVFSRPYPLATAGQPHKLSFDITTKKFDYQFYPDPSQTLPTEIFVSSFHYPGNTFAVSTSSDLTWKMSDENANILLVHNGPSSSDETVSFVKIDPTPQDEFISVTVLEHK